MKIAIALPREPNGRAMSTTTISSFAPAVEARGFAGIWAYDELGRGYIRMDPLIALAAVAASTRTVEVGTCIMQLPIRGAFDLALRALSVQRIAGSRFVFGVGAGSSHIDYAATGSDFSKRWVTFSSHLSALQALWAGRTHDGASIEVWPDLVGGPPLMIGSWGSDRWLRRAADEFDGWIASAYFSTWDVLADAATRYREMTAKRAVVANLVVQLPGARYDQERPADTVNLCCTVSEARDRLARLQELGFSDVVLTTDEVDERNLDRLMVLLEP